MTRTRRHLSVALAIAVLAALAASPGSSPRAQPRHRQLLIIVDGLRPDYVTAELMPRLSALAARGVRFTNHHAVFPTVTRVNAASFTTGAYPERHGLLGNSVFRPAVDPQHFLDTGDLDDLDRIIAVEPLLTATTLGEALQATGQRLLVVSSGSAGSGLVNNPTIAGGAVLHREFARPERLAEAMRGLASTPTADASGGALDAHAVDAFLEVGVPQVDPAITVLWLGSLDAIAHRHGVGGPVALEALRAIDVQIGRVQDGLSARGLIDDYTIWVSSDHGFSTHTGAPDVSSVLAPLTQVRPDGRRSLVVGGGAVYVREDASRTRNAMVSRIVEALQRTPGIGPVFTSAGAPGSLDGRVPGTLSFDAIRWQHAGAADILYASEWSDASNAVGRPGTASAGGTAGHGTASPWDIHNTLIAAGRGMARGRVIDLPSGNVDLAPTLLSMLGVPVPASAQGRVLREAFASDRAGPRATGASPSAGRLDATTSTSTHAVRTPDGSYGASATFSIVRDGDATYRYLDRITTTRPAASAGR